MALSTRGRRSVKPGLPYFSLFFEGVERGLHSAANPDGYVLLAVAENRLCYEAMAIELASAASSLASMRGSLEVGIAGSRLFDTEQFTRALEKAFVQMHARRLAGLGPEHIVL